MINRESNFANYCRRFAPYRVITACIYIISLQAFNASATVSTASFHEIATIKVWAEYAGQVFLIELVDPGTTGINAQCPGGYWLENSSTTNASVLSTALTAYHTKSKVKIWAEETEDWTFLSSTECKIKLIQLE